MNPLQLHPENGRYRVTAFPNDTSQYAVRLTVQRQPEGEVISMALSSKDVGDFMRLLDEGWRQYLRVRKAQRDAETPMLWPTKETPDE